MLLIWVDVFWGSWAYAAVNAAAEIPRITESSSVPVQPPVQPQAVAGQTVVRSASVPEDVVVPVVPDQSAERSRTPSEYGGMEYQDRAA